MRAQREGCHPGLGRPEERRDPRCSRRKPMPFAIKTAIRDPRATSFSFPAQKTGISD